ncbi:acyl-CoA synthetase [Haloferacaceae archaeon DSL9]
MSWQIRLDEPSYERALEAFSWEQIPDDYNIADDCLRKHDYPDRPALLQAFPDGRRETYAFGDLDLASNRIADALADLGIGEGDRVAVVVPQKPANPLTHLACWKLGAISVPLSILFGPDALGYRLRDSGAAVVVADESVLDTVAAVRDNCPELEAVVGVDVDIGAADPPEGVLDWESFAAAHEPSFDIAETSADTPAIIIYTSGSTGPPKGVLHAHGVWLGHCPAFYSYFERDVDDSVFWTPADWAWIGALGDVVFPAWHYGRPVVGYPAGGFDPETAYEILEEFGVTDAFLPPTAIRMLMGVEAPADRYDLSLKSLCSGGEPLTPEISRWADAELDGVVVNEIYGQTEANLLVCDCRDWFPSRTGSLGKPVVGHEVAVVDPETGEPKASGEIGTIAVRREGDPVVFAEYWNEPAKTDAVRVDGWHLTGDLGVRDEDGYFWFKSRDDDVIITSGYRVGPGEVERAVLDHPDVEQVGVVGVPDDVRGEIIKAFVQPITGVGGSDDLREEIRDLVRDRLAKYEYPREIEFVDELPRTTTGKIQRRKLRERS